MAAIDRVMQICNDLNLGCTPDPAIPDSDWELWLSGFEMPEQRTCPACGSQMEKRTGRYGDFWGCSGYPQCKHTEAVS
jgi:hypothetical protein